MSLISEPIRTPEKYWPLPLPLRSVFRGRDDDSSLFNLSSSITIDVDEGTGHVEPYVTPQASHSCDPSIEGVPGRISAKPYDPVSLTAIGFMPAEQSKLDSVDRRSPLQSEEVSVDLDERYAVRSRSNSNSANSLPVPRYRTPLKPGNFREYAEEYIEPEKQQVAVAAKMVPKVNILKVPRRSIGSVTSLSLDDQTLHSYAKDDYANYAIGDILHHDVEWYIEPWINLLW
jgi:hypothetical protein